MRGAPARMLADSYHIDPESREVGGRARTIGKSLLVAVDDSASIEIVNRKFNDHLIAGKNADEMLAHLAADMGENDPAVFQFDPKHCIRERYLDDALYLDGIITGLPNGGAR